MKLRRILEWVPAIIAAVVIPVVIVAYYNPFASSSSTPKAIATVEAFAPIKVNPFTLVTQGPYRIGQTISMKNGVCNVSKDTVAVSITLGVREETDPLRARNVVVLPREGTASLMLPIAPGCLPNSDVLTGPLPPSVGPGKWRVYLILIAQGSDSKKQMITMQSDAFEVVP